MKNEPRRMAKPTREEARKLLLTTKDAALAGDVTATLALSALLLTDAIERSLNQKPVEVDINELY